MDENPQFAKEFEAMQKQVKKHLAQNPNLKANCTTPTFFPIAVLFDWVSSAAEQTLAIYLTGLDT